MTDLQYEGFYTMKITIILGVGLWAVACSAQTTVNGGRVFEGTLRSSGANAVVDFSGAGSTAPVKAGLSAARPSSCTAGQMYFASDAAAGQNLSLCAGSPGTWTAVATGNAATLDGTGRLTVSEIPTGVVQTGQSNTYTAGTQDMSGSAHTLPSKKGATASIPSTCTTGEEYFATDATAGQNKYYCTAANTWTQQAAGGGGGGGASPGAPSGGLQKNNGAGGLSGQGMIYSNLYGGGTERQLGLNCTPKMTLSYTAFTAAAATQQIKVGTVPAYWFPSAMLLNEAAQFTSGSGQVSALAASIGTVASSSYYVQPLPLMQAAPNYKGDNVNSQPASLLSHDIYVQVNVMNANPGNLGNGTTTNLTGGSLEVAVCGGTWQ